MTAGTYQLAGLDATSCSGHEGADGGGHWTGERRGGDIKNKYVCNVISHILNVYFLSDIKIQLLSRNMQGGV